MEIPCLRYAHEEPHLLQSHVEQKEFSGRRKQKKCNDSIHLNCLHTLQACCEDITNDGARQIWCTEKGSGLSWRLCIAVCLSLSSYPQQMCSVAAILLDWKRLWGVKRFLIWMVVMVGAACDWNLLILMLFWCIVFDLASQTCFQVNVPHNFHPITLLQLVSSERLQLVSSQRLLPVNIFERSLNDRMLFQHEWTQSRQCVAA